MEKHTYVKCFVVALLHQNVMCKNEHYNNVG